VTPSRESQQSTLHRTRDTSRIDTTGPFLNEIINRFPRPALREWTGRLLARGERLESWTPGHFVERILFLVELFDLREHLKEIVKSLFLPGLEWEAFVRKL
jgi:hypothetical protein